MGAALSKHNVLKLEIRRQRLLSRRAFARRVALSFGAASVLIAGYLLGRHDRLPCTGRVGVDRRVRERVHDPVGDGPAGPPKTWGGKLVSALDGLYSCLAVILAVGLLVTPVVHRMLHQFHLEIEEQR
jgi:hypothetical protein